MAVRGIFIPKDKYPYFEEVFIEFDWFGGFASVQKQKNVLSLHMNVEAAYPEWKHIEISSKSWEDIGKNLSAMELKKFSTELDKYVVLESAFQTSRIYFSKDGRQIGPFPQWLELDGREAKKKVKEESQGLIARKYLFEGKEFPVPEFHISLFYDWLYINALLEDENKKQRDDLINGSYNAFSDLATKSLNSQARSCALFVSLHKQGLLDAVKDYDTYMKLFRVSVNEPVIGYAAEGAWNDVQVLQKNGTYKPLRPAAKKTFDKQTVIDEFNKRNGTK